MTSDRQGPVLDPLSLEPRLGSSYPEPFKASTAERIKRRLGDVLGLRSFGVNLVHLPPGSASALRHWHSHEDEFVYVLSGRITLVTEAGEQVLGPGMVAGFPAGVADGHCLVNRSPETASYLEVGERRPEEDSVVYPDVDLAVAPGRIFTTKAGEPY